MLIILSMAGFIAFAVWSPYFDLKQIIVSRDNPNIDVKAIESELQDFYGQNLLFLDQGDMRYRLKTAFPAFRDIDVQEIWPASLTLKITLSPPAFTLLNETDAGFWVVSEDGVVLSEQASETLPLLKVFGYPKPLQIGERFVDKTILDQVIIAEAAMANELKIPVSERHLYPLARELHLVAETGTAFWLDLQLDTVKQLQKIEYAANRINLVSGTIEHVDLRIPNQLYWKPRE